MLGQVGQVCLCGFTIDVVRLPSDVFHSFCGVVEFLELFGRFPVEEVSFNWWLGWAGVEQDLVGLPQLGHDAASMSFNQFFFIRQ